MHMNLRITVAVFFCIMIVAVVLADNVFAVVTPDAYEEDDSFVQAKTIVLNDKTAQHHSFHDSGDIDWVMFYGVAGEIYEIRAFNVGARADVVLELYDSAVSTALSQKDANSAGGEERISWRSTASGLYYVKVRNYDPAISGENTAYDFEIFRPTAPQLTGAVRGTIVDASTGTPIGGSIVTSNAADSGISAQGSGDYSLLTPATQMDITALADGYTPASQNVNVRQGDIQRLDFSLNPIVSQAPAGQGGYSYQTSVRPVFSSDASRCRPFAVGSINTGILNLQIGLPKFTGAVDVYLGIYAPHFLSSDIVVVRSDGSLKTLSEGLIPWKSRVTSVINETLFGNIPTSLLPKGRVYLYIAVTPAGTGNLEKYYLWETYFDIT